MIRARMCPAVLVTLMALAAPARADVTICNRTSYRMQVAVGLERGPLVSTQGCLRIDPGECKHAQAAEADMAYLHTRTPPIYGAAPLPQHGDADFCVRDSDFQFSNVRACPMSQQARFSVAKPSDSPNEPVVTLAEEADYDDAQARLAGV